MTMTTTVKGPLRNITGASVETGVPVTTIREWDPLIEPIRVDSGMSSSHRLYDDTHIIKIKKIAQQKRKPHGV